MDTEHRFQIRLSPEAEHPFLALPESERAHLQSILEGLAEVSALAPPHFPNWFGRYGVSAPLLRISAAGLRISFEIDCRERALRICSIEDPVRRVTAAPAHPDGRLALL